MGKNLDGKTEHICALWNEHSGLIPTIILRIDFRVLSNVELELFPGGPSFLIELFIFEIPCTVWKLILCLTASSGTF